MSKESLPFICYRDQIIRAVTGNRPAMVWNVTDAAALDRIVDRLVESERVCEMLQHKGYWKTNATLEEVVAAIPAKL